jgi:hypothetical protein
MKLSFRTTSLVFGFCLAATIAPAQEFRGTISGTVTDPAGAVVPDAKISAVESATGTKLQTASESTGDYTLPFLSPGNYDLTVQATGFKESIRKGIHVAAGAHVVIDIALEVGNTTQSVEVTADAPLVNTENAAVGQTITTKEVEDLPLNGRTPLVLASLSIGVLATGQPSLIHPFDSGAAAGWSIAGAAAQTNEIQINGSPDATWDGRLAYSPPADAVQEVSVKTFDTDSSSGHTAGGTINQVMKSGTNALHGSAWEFNQPNTLLANNYFNNKNGLLPPVTHYNQYGITAGGPVFVPKAFDGRNKLFWFFAWESVKDSQPNTTLLSVATPKERTGDFSDLLAVGTQYQLYNPYSATQSGTLITRAPYSGNIIPASQLSPIAANYLKLMPLPNLPGSANGFNNYASTAPTPDDFSNELGRMDYNASDRDRMFFDIRRTDYIQTKNNYFANASTGSILTRANWGGTFDNVFTLNPTNVFDLRVNFTRMDEAHPSPSQGVDPAALGFPAYMTTTSQYLQMPNIAFAGATGFTTMGFTGANKLPSQSFQLFGSWVKLKGNHSFKFGGEFRQYVLNTVSYANSAGSFSFSANSWVKATSSASSTVVQGQDLAELLLGLPTSGSYDLNTSAAYFEHYGAVYFQDDWRVRRNLTLNLGARFDYDAPYHEKYGRTVNGFDGTSTNPLSAAATAAYAAKPIPQLPPANFKVLGGLTFPTDGAMYQQTSHIISPRIGLAWTPDAMHGKTVVRSGFAIFVQPVTISQLGIGGAYSTNPIQQQYGFSQTTSYTASNNSFLSPATNLSDPFPTGIKQPVGSSLGLGTFAGQTIQVMDPNIKDPYSIRWNFGIQHSFTPNTVLEVVYTGSHSVALPIYVTQLNGIPASYLSTLGTRDQPVITALSATNANPFAGLATAQNGSTATVAQILAKFPEFPVGTGSGGTGVIELNHTAGSSFYESLNVRFQKRFSDGLTAAANYIYSKTIDRTTWLNDTDPAPEKRISPNDHPQRIVLATAYELPFGRGRKFSMGGSRTANIIFGDWGLNSIYTYQVGAPVTWVNGSTTSPGDYVYFGAPIVLDNRNNNSPAFNTTAFDTAAANQFQYHIRTFSTTFPNLRMDGINEWSPSVSKRFFFTESANLQLRLEAYNVLNHPTFGPPNTTATSAAFGTITTQANRPRTLQIGARLVF